MRASSLLSSISILMALVVSACSTGGAGTRSFEYPLGLDQSRSIERAVMARAHRLEVPLAPERLAGEVAGVYRHLGLEAASPRDSDPFTFLTPTMQITGRLYEGEPNSLYIDCGTAVQGERADLFQIEFALATRLRPSDDGGSVVETRMEGRAQDRFVNETPVTCAGTGKLEAEIDELLRRGGVG